MPERSAISQTFFSIADRMRSDFANSAAQLQHRGLRGRVRESSFGSYLDDYLPQKLLKRYNCEIVATDGSVSSETDVAICDESTPPLRTLHGVDVVPVECVLATIEVKSHLDVPALREAWEKLTRVKRFPKTAYIQPRRPTATLQLFGKDWTYFPTFAFVFAYDSVALDLLGDAMFGLSAGTEPEHRIDAIWVLEKGSVTWLADDGEWRFPKPGRRGIRLIDNVAGTSPIPLMTMHLQGLLQQVLLPPFRIGDYMGNLPFGVERSAFDDDNVDGHLGR